MENIAEKKEWLKNEYAKRLAELSPDAERLWGKMNVQQMIEHMSYSIRIANGRLPISLVTPAEHLERMQAFLASEKPFRENTPNSLLSDTPLPVEQSSIGDAIKELQEEIDHFFEVYEQNPDLKIMNAFFGELDFDMQVQLLHKHAWHHLRQFGINEAN